MYFTFLTILLTVTLVVSVVSVQSSHWVSHDDTGHAGLWLTCSTQNK